MTSSLYLVAAAALVLFILERFFPLRKARRRLASRLIVNAAVSALAIAVGLSIVNPIAMILSAAMMLDHIGEIDKANLIRKAIAGVVAEGKVRTYDMMRISGGAKAISQGAASTTQMTDAILYELEKVQTRELAAASTRELVLVVEVGGNGRKHN